MDKENNIKGYIYKITNLINGKIYIGKTTYNNIQKRFYQHKIYALSTQGGGPLTLHQAIRDYGIENFKIELEDTVYDPDILEEVERKYILLYHSWIKDPECNGYNQSQGGEGVNYNNTDFNEYLLEKIIKTYEETKNQAETARKLNINVTTVHNYLVLNNISLDDAKTVAIRETGKKVAIYKENEIVAIFPSLGEAARHFEDKETASHISEVCYGKRSRVKGYTAKFTDEEVFNENCILPTLFVQSSNKKKKCYMLNAQTDEILQVFESGCEVGRYFNMPVPKYATTCIAKAIERNGTWKGYKWKRD